MSVVFAYAIRCSFSVGRKGTLSRCWNARVRAPDRIQPADERQQRPVELPLLQLVLLRAEVLLAALVQRRVLEVSKPE